MGRSRKSHSRRSTCGKLASVNQTIHALANPKPHLIGQTKSTCGKLASTFTSPISPLNKLKTAIVPNGEQARGISEEKLDFALAASLADAIFQVVLGDEFQGNIAQSQRNTGEHRGTISSVRSWVGGSRADRGMYLRSKPNESLAGASPSPALPDKRLFRSPISVDTMR
jgi:hypothetical protein